MRIKAAIALIHRNVVVGRGVISKLGFNYVDSIISGVATVFNSMSLLLHLKSEQLHAFFKNLNYLIPLLDFVWVKVLLFFFQSNQNAFKSFLIWLEDFDHTVYFLVDCFSQIIWNITY